MMNDLAADAPTMSTPMSKVFTIVCHNVVGGVCLLEKKMKDTGVHIHISGA